MGSDWPICTLIIIWLKCTCSPICVLEQLDRSRYVIDVALCAPDNCPATVQQLEALFNFLSRARCALCWCPRLNAAWACSSGPSRVCLSSIVFSPHKYIELIHECPAEHHDTIPFARVRPVRVLVISQVSDIAERSHARIRFIFHWCSRCTLRRMFCITINVLAQAHRHTAKVKKNKTRYNVLPTTDHCRTSAWCVIEFHCMRASKLPGPAQPALSHSIVFYLLYTLMNINMIYAILLTVLRTRRCRSTSSSVCRGISPRRRPDRAECFVLFVLLLRNCGENIDWLDLRSLQLTVRRVIRSDWLKNVLFNSWADNYYFDCILLHFVDKNVLYWNIVHEDMPWARHEINDFILDSDRDRSNHERQTRKSAKIQSYNS